MRSLNRISKNTVDEYEVLQPLLSSIYAEIQTLSKKKHDATLNKSKVEMINTILERVKTLLKAERGIEFLYLLDDEALPQYSDVVLILSQYEVALKKFKNEHYGYDSDVMSHIWLIEYEDEDGEDE